MDNPLVSARRRRVVHLTSVHRVDDARIFQKECRTLGAAGFEVALVGPSKTSDKSDSVQIHAVPVARSRLRRMTVTILQVFIGALRAGATICHFHDPELLAVGSS